MGFVVFGATGGIGEEVCELLYNKGEKFVVTGRNLEKIEFLKNKYNVYGRECDAQSFSTIEQFIQDAKDELGEIKGVVNCVGSLLLKPAHLTSESEFISILSTNLNSAFGIIRSSVKQMGEKGGSIVLVSSAAARIGLSNHEAIATAKAGIIGLTLSAATTYSNKNIRINCVAPGLTKTNLTQKITSSPVSEKASLSLHPLKRFGEPRDVANTICFLLDDQNSWITGQTIGVDGGLGSLKTL